MSFRFSTLFVLSLVASISAFAKERPLSIVTTLPSLAWLVAEVGGARVAVESLLRGTEDPHYVDALPSFVQKIAQADAVCFVGMELEDAWLPKVIERAGNAKLHKGGTGHCNLGLWVQVMDKPQAGMDRSHGHIHGAGNPHWYLSLASLAEASDGVVALLKGLKPQHRKEFLKNQMALKQKIRSELKRLRSRLPQDLRLLEYHQEFAYVLRDFGLQSKGSIEEIPGVPPSAAGLSRARTKINQEMIEVILATKAHSKKMLEAASTDSNARVIQIEPMPSLSLNPLEYNDFLAQELLATQQKDFVR